MLIVKALENLLGRMPPRAKAESQTGTTALDRRATASEWPLVAEIEAGWPWTTPYNKSQVALLERCDLAASGACMKAE